MNFLILGCGGERNIYSDPEWLKTISLYEITPYQYQNLGGLKGITQDLSRINSMFFTGLVLQPVTLRDQANNAFNPSSPFAIQDYLIIEPLLGSNDDLLVLLDSAHAFNMKVIFSWNLTETGPHHKYKNEYPEFYRSNEKMKERRYNADYIKLNHELPEVQQQQLKSFKLFIKKFPFDGTILYGDSLDVQMMLPLVKQVVPSNFFVGQTHTLGNTASIAGKNPLLLPFFDKCFTEGLDTLFFNDVLQFTIDKPCFNAFIDYEYNCTQGSDFLQFPNAYTYYIMFTHLIPGIPWTLNGQENGLTQVINPFDPNSIQRQYQFNRDLFRSLNYQRKFNPAMTYRTGEGQSTLIGKGHNVVALERKSGDKYIVGIFNFGDQKASIRINNDYTDAFDLFNKIPVQYKSHQDIFLGPYQALMFSNVP